MSAIILRAPRSESNPVVLGTRLIGDHKVSQVVANLAAIARFNPIGLADLFEFDAWTQLSPLHTSQENKRDVYGVGELHAEAEATRSPYSSEHWSTGDDDLFLLFGTTVVWMDSGFVLAYDFRETGQMVDPALARHGSDVYARFDLLNPISWGNLEAIDAYAFLEERGNEKRRRLRTGESNADPAFDYLG